MGTTRSDIPLEGITHGYGGWRKGCGCFVCRRGKADSQAKYRERKNGFDPGDPPKVTMPDGCGEIETLVRTEIIGLGVLSDEGSTIAALAIKSAKLLDKIEAEGKYHLQGSTVKTLRELMRELRGTLNPQRRPEEDEDDELAGLRTFGPQS